MSLVWAGASLAWPAAPANSHQSGMSAATLRLATDGRFRLDLFLDVTALFAGVTPGHLLDEDIDWILALSPADRDRHLDDLRAVFDAGIRVLVDGEVVRPEVFFPDIERAPGKVREGIGLPGNRVRLAGTLAPGSHTVSVAFPDFLGPTVLTVHAPGGRATGRTVLAPGRHSEPYRLDGAGWTRSRTSVAWAYLVLGYEHILPKGVDHILFVLGLFLLSTRLRALLLQVTAFTLAHSVTLALSIYGVISLPSSVVEPLIAISIAYIAIENIVTSELKPWRPAVVFGFGLLHGLGFAGVLRDLGLPRGDFLTAVVTFNVGVEFGQLSVIALAFLVAGWFHSRTWYRTRMVVPASLVIAAVAIYWTVERVFWT